MKVFSKEKMLERLEREGRLHQVDKESRDLMDILDGKEAVKNDYKALVFGRLEYFVRHEDECFPVNPNDCIEK